MTVVTVLISPTSRELIGSSYIILKIDPQNYFRRDDQDQVQQRF